MKSLVKSKKDWKLVGHIGVDAGLCWIGDPCYILHQEGEGLPSTLGKDWKEFCDAIHSASDKYPTMKSFNYELGHEGLGVCVSTGYGDGSYPVYAHLSEGRVAGLFVDFMGCFGRPVE